MSCHRAVEGVLPLQELIDGRAVGRLEGHGEVREGRGLLPEALPAFPGVGELSPPRWFPGHPR